MDIFRSLTDKGGVNFSRLLIIVLSAVHLCFSATNDNPVVWQKAANPANPRNSEGAFLGSDSGRVLFVYTEFYGGAADESPARLVAVESADAGATWTREPRPIIENVGARNVMSVSLLRLHSGRVALFYLVKNSWHDCRPWIRVSSDDGRTWSEPRLVVPAPGYFVLNNDRVIQTSGGRLILPVAFHRARRGDPNDRASFDRRAVALWYLSDDEGETWREADDWWSTPVPSRNGLQEPGVVELASGHLLSWARTDLGAQWTCTSTNLGVAWSPPQPSQLISPLSPASIKRVPGSDRLLAVYNDHSGQFRAPTDRSRRTPLVAAVSSDDGRTWPKAKLLEDDPDGHFCYTAIHFTADAVLLAYSDFQRPGSKVPARLMIRRVGLKWLEQ